MCATDAQFFRKDDNLLNNSLPYLRTSVYIIYRVKLPQIIVYTIDLKLLLETRLGIKKKDGPENKT